MDTFKREEVLESVRYYRTIFDWDFVIEEKDYERGMKVWVPTAVDKPIPFKQAVDMSLRQEGAGQVQVSCAGAARPHRHPGPREDLQPRALARSPPSPPVSFDVHEREFVAIVGPVRLRQVHHPQHDRRPRRAHRRARSWWTASGWPARPPPRSATSSRRTPSFPGAPSSATSRSASSTAACRRAERGRARARGDRAGRARGLRGRLPGHALGRHAPAGGPDALAGGRTPRSS